jgi:hypothetical protein
MQLVHSSATATPKQVCINIGKLTANEEDFARQINPQQQNHDATNHTIREEMATDLIGLVQWVDRIDE